MGRVDPSGILYLQDERTRDHVSAYLLGQDIPHTPMAPDVKTGVIADARISYLTTYIKTIHAVDGVHRDELTPIGEFDPAQGDAIVYSTHYIDPVHDLLRRHGFHVRSIDWDTTNRDATIVERRPRSQVQSGKRHSFGPILVAKQAFKNLPASLKTNLSLKDIGKSDAEGRASKNSEEFSDIQRSWLYHQPATPDSWAKKSFKALFDLEPNAVGTCRICGAVSPSNGDISYCLLCCKTAISGSWMDDGLEGEQTSRAVWALAELGKIEFSTAPSLEQLATINSRDPMIIDQLVLCRFAIPRVGQKVGRWKGWRGWTEWLTLSGLLEDPVKTSRGMQSLAMDGHFCRSLLERRVDDFFTLSKIQHEVEPHYPYHPDLNTTGLRADWVLGDGTFVEAWGLLGSDPYDLKVSIKKRLAKEKGIKLVSITNDDIPNLPKIFKDWIQ